MCETPVFCNLCFFWELGERGLESTGPRRFLGEAKQQQLEGQDSQSPPINLGCLGRFGLKNGVLGKPPACPSGLEKENPKVSGWELVFDAN